MPAKRLEAMSPQMREKDRVKAGAWQICVRFPNSLVCVKSAKVISSLSLRRFLPRFCHQ
jgi:hypothetical protein